MIDPDKPITLNDLIENIKIEADFVAWEWANENRLTIKLMFGDTTLTEQSVTIEPSGYEREKSEW